MPRVSIAVVVVLLGLAVMGCGRPQVTMRSLLHEMTDLEELATYPDPPFVCRQASSYDRASVSAEDGETWFANADWGHFVRVEHHGARQEYVLLDVDGPGAVVRIWSANPAGTLRVYIDHAEEPVIEEEMAALLRGEIEGFSEPLAGARSRGHNLYLPIPYAEHCKITSDDSGFYYHVNYRTYPPKTRLRSFRRGDVARLSHEIAAAAEYLGEPPRGPEKVREWVTVEREWWWRTDTPAALVGLEADLPTDMTDEQLRRVVLTLSFDGCTTVECPLGDFFGSAPGVNPYRSTPAGMTPAGTLWCRWVMPFRETVSVGLRATDESDPGVALRVAFADHAWTDETLYFHAQWRAEHEIPTRPKRDWNYVDLEGRGVFVGAALMIANPSRVWWGEGDEKIYVDGESFPSHFGTGTEDYYGYAWCWPETFEHAYHNQTRCDGPGNYGFTSVNRWHVLDKIPFEESLRFDMELWHWVPEIDVDMAVTTYWYGALEMATNGTPLTEETLTLRAMPVYEPDVVDGAIEGETLDVIERSGTARPQEVLACSNESHLWWTDAGPGDRLVVEFPAEQAGLHRVFARLVRAPDYGIVRLSVNGEPVVEEIDGYAKSVAVSPELSLGRFDLRAGANTLEIEIVGANRRAEKAYMFGLDYVRLEAAN